MLGAIIKLSVRVGVRVDVKRIDNELSSQVLIENAPDWIVCVKVCVVHHFLVMTVPTRGQVRISGLIDNE
jgi:hypothetical protein